MVMHMGDHIRLVINAACVERDMDYLRGHFQNRLPVSLTKLQRALVAIQGPMAEAVLSDLIAGVADLAFMQLGRFSFGGHEVQISRSGYTGEDGFEISLPEVAARMFVEAVCATGQAELAGLVARDSLRLEAGLCLYGQDMDENISVMDAGLGWAVGRARRPGGEREGRFQGAKERWQNLEVALHGNGLVPCQRQTGLFAQAQNICRRKDNNSYRQCNLWLTCPVCRLSCCDDADHGYIKSLRGMLSGLMSEGGALR